MSSRAVRIRFCQRGLPSVASSSASCSGVSSSATFNFSYMSDAVTGPGSEIKAFSKASSVSAVLGSESATTFLLLGRSGFCRPQCRRWRLILLLLSRDHRQLRLKRSFILIRAECPGGFDEAIALRVGLWLCSHIEMYLCFIDESGTPPKRTASSPRPYFILAGVIIHEAQWHEIARELDVLRRTQRFKVLGEIKWRFFGGENTDPRNSVAHLSPAMRDEFRKRFFEILTKRRSVKVIGCVANIKRAYTKKYVEDEEDLYFHTYKPLTERFEYFLQDTGKEVGTKQYGVIVADHRGKKQDDSLRSSHQRVVEDKAAFTSKYSSHIETLFLTPSHLSVGIQFADMVAGAMGRGFNTGDWSHFRLIRNAIRTSADGKIEGHGVAKFPADWKWEPPGGS